MDPATSPGDSGSDLDGPVYPQADGLDEAPVPKLHIKETLSVPTRPDLSSGTKAYTLLASYPEGQGDDEADSSTGTMSSRAYQLEMLDQSLKRNVIVAMDTGSGKTQVAVLRIKAELEKCLPEKIVWFLAPTVSLCEQQFEVIKLQANAVPMRLLTGNDNVDSWSSATWDAILGNVRVVVSTYQVLLDALSHGFIKMRDLALIIFDEVHNCVRKHPGSKIMIDFYHRQREDGLQIPAILGLTASPSMRSHISDLELLETTLDAKCVSPTLHREELIKCVKKPQISYVSYIPSNFQPTATMRSLREAYVGLDILEDPHIRMLRRNPSDRNRRALEKAITKYDTFIQNQMRGLCSRSESICQELGPWAADRYICKVVEGYHKRLDDSKGEFFDQWISEEKSYLGGILLKIGIEKPSELLPAAGVSHKVKLLLEQLLSVEDNVVGIVFVKERATVSMLCDLLSVCRPIVDKYRIGAMVGTSNNAAKKKNVHELLDKTGIMTLQSFRSGKINLLIATSVLEEGIDVPACNFVVCFDQPATSKSFIQRRGRARMRDSKLVLFLDTYSGKDLQHWQALEEEMKKQYQDEEREFRQLEMLEESEQTGSKYFVVKATGARLDFDNARQHLEHFCRVLSQGEFVDSRPDFIINPQANNIRLRAAVILPTFVPVGLRHAESQSTWLSEKNATKDAAFQAYKALYDAGLVNDNLLPFKLGEIPGVEGRAPEVDVEQPLRPWHQTALAWKGTEDRWLYSLGCYEGEKLMDEYEIMLPTRLDQPQPIEIFLSHDKKCEIRFSPGKPISAARAAKMPDHTSTLLALHYIHRWPVEERQHVIQAILKGGHVSMEQIASLRFDPENTGVTNQQYLVRDQAKTPFLYTGMIPYKPPAEQVHHTFYEYEKGPANVPYLHLSKWTRRSDFLHRLHGDQAPPSSKRFSWVLPQSWATVDTIPIKHAQFGMMIPSVIHSLEVMLVAKQLSTTLLKSVNVGNLELLREALSSRSASEPVNYERLEFLGDSILKYCTSIQASTEHPEWPEGYLSFFRDRLIANSRLSRAALEKGLAKFILTKPFTGQKWRPLYVDDIIEQGTHSITPDRRLSTKTLADVVESLIGAAYQDGGIAKATSCISLFLGELQWKQVDENRESLFLMTQRKDRLPAVLAPLEELIGYSFQKKALLMEAMTHASYVADTENRSLERLEFLGDAMLDNIIVTKLFAVEPPLSHHQMHMLKTATVNSDFLAFVVLEYGLHRPQAVITDDGELEERDVFLPLWKFMRHASIAIGLEQDAMVARHKNMRDDILAAMEHGTHYPWALLARLQAKKFFSDVFEALLGAVWVDSGSMDTCAGIASRFGILPYLDRMLRDGVHVQHPKEELGKWAVTETVTYDIKVEEGSDGGREYACGVRVGSRLVVEVDGGVSREEVKTKAAEQAVRILTKEKEG